MRHASRPPYVPSRPWLPSFACCDGGRSVTAVARLIIARLLSSIIVLLVVATLVFWSTAVGSGDTATRILGREATPQQVHVLERKLHLDKPPAERYVGWLSGVVRLDFGVSVAAQKPVTAVIAPKLRNSLLLAAVALALYIPMTLLGAIVSAVYQGRSPDHVIAVVTLIAGLSIPEFVLGTALLVFFVLVVPLVPVTADIDSANSLIDYAKMLTLPSFVVALGMSAYGIRMLRDNLIDVLQAENVQYARLKGMPRHRVILRHALPSAVVPFLNVTALNLTSLFGGVLIVEVVFGYPGIGSLLVESISFRDGPLIAAVALIPAAVYILANLAADVAAILLTPRLRTR
jgi:peptide/nickel transport system permease protein